MAFPNIEHSDIVLSCSETKNHKKIQDIGRQLNSPLTLKILKELKKQEQTSKQLAVKIQPWNENYTNFYIRCYKLEEAGLIKSFRKKKNTRNVYYKIVINKITISI